MSRSSADLHADRIAWILFGLLVALCLTLGAALSIEEQPFEDTEKNGEVVRVYHGHGVAHPRVNEMLHGGAGEKRQERIFGLSWLFGVLQVAFVTGCLVFGVGARRPSRTVVAGVLGVGAVGIATMSLLFWSYSETFDEPSLSMFAGLPIPSAWLVYGLWLFPFIFCGIYFVYFHRVWFSEDVSEKFQRLLKSERNAETS